jgi:hypothetical protein
MTPPPGGRLPVVRGDGVARSDCTLVAIRSSCCRNWPPDSATCSAAAGRDRKKVRPRARAEAHLDRVDDAASHNPDSSPAIRLPD